MTKEVHELKSPEVELYFSFIIGQVLETSGHDMKALNAYINCREILANAQVTSSRLNMLKAVPFAGMGSALYHMEEYELAARCFYKARFIRESTLGPNSVELAVISNNLGCCYFKLDRTAEALTYFELAHAIMDLELGKFNQRTLAVGQNIKKVKRKYIGHTPSYQTLWRCYTPKEGITQKKTKGKK